MNKEYKGKHIYECELGLYRIHWEDVGTSLACIRQNRSGDRIACIANWISKEVMIKDIMGKIDKIELIRGVQEEYDDYDESMDDFYSKSCAFDIPQDNVGILDMKVKDLTVEQLMGLNGKFLSSLR